MAKLKNIRSTGRGRGQREFTISELASVCGVTQRTIRFYEDQELLAPRRVGQIRIFSARDRARLELILRGKRLGFSLAEIKEMLELYEVDTDHMPQLRATLAKGRKRIVALEGRQRDIASTLAELKEIERRVVERLKAKGIDIEIVAKSGAA